MEFLVTLDKPGTSTAKILWMNESGRTDKIKLKESNYMTRCRKWKASETKEDKQQRDCKSKMKRNKIEDYPYLKRLLPHTALSIGH